MGLLYIKRRTISVKSGSDSNQVTRPTGCDTWDSWEIVGWWGHRLWGARVCASRHDPSGWEGQRYSSKNICHPQVHSTWETNPPSPMFCRAHHIFIVWQWLIAYLIRLSLCRIIWIVKLLSVELSKVCSSFIFSYKFCE